MEPETFESVFSNKFLKVNKTLLRISGLWPNQPWIQKVAARFFVLSIFAVTSVPSVNGVRIHCFGNMRSCAENLTGVFFICSCGTKFLVTFLAEESMRGLYEEVAKTWLSIIDPEEKAIMRKYAKIGYWKTIGYVGYFASTGMYYSQSSLAPIVLDIVFPLNGSRQKIVPINGEYFFDPYEYFHVVYLGCCLGSLASVLTFTSIDTTYTAIVHQVIGRFNVVKHRLRLAAQNQSDEDEDFAYETIKSAINLHLEALKSIEMIESTYDLCFLVLIGVTMPFLAFEAITILETIDNPVECIRYVMFEIAQLIHVFFMSWPSQRVTDESFDILTQIYAIEWYNLSESSKTLLKIMMTKCLRPIHLTAGGLYIMNFENFAMMVKTTCSYITVLISFRE